jgi:hypothetical protein
MKSRTVLTLFAGIALGLIGGHVSIGDASAQPPGSTTTLEVTLQSDADFLFDNESTGKDFKVSAGRVRDAQDLVTLYTGRRDLLAPRVRSGLVKQRSALENIIPATLTDIAIGYTDSNGNGRRDAGENEVRWLWLNGDATDLHTKVSSPPAGIAVGP